MSKVFQLEDVAWEPVRPALTSGIFGRTLLDAGTKMVFTRVEPGGSFAAHVDSYGHLMYVLSGSGLATSGGREFPLTAGTVMQIDAGEQHSYQNDGTEQLVLITLNLPV